LSQGVLTQTQTRKAKLELTGMSLFG